MKKIYLILLLLSSFWVQAQNKEVQSNTVSVSGKSLVERKTTLYKAKISLNMEQLYYSDPTCKSLEDLKDKYFKELETYGVDPNELVEKKMEFIAYGYQREGTVFELETTSEEKIKKLAQIKMTGVTVQYQFKSVIDAEQREKLLKEALVNSKENALRICKAINKKLGDIISVTDTSTQNAIWNSYHNGYEEYATIYVTYAMK
ncbi:hypothetical protein MTsPCn9_28910 [Croceitalea sp. MTPC9]|uniref:SIMPL domain-containing protein n=1 Tax=unclassified Croceitalea TaxID=2632280 RepID=UPI002B3D36BE|nr:hypothetical protein MTsPCn6_30400 [Croceitalea sp. MTPC6]GMN17951.1 hypothetical protein MTsPCn9_28910 [Croceitalea sp. MTPC9]